MQIAVVTGEHGFQEKQFDAVFENMAGIEFVREDLDVFVDDPGQQDYDTVVFYNFHRPYPTAAQAEAILGLTARGQGIVILHHAILAFPEWVTIPKCAGLPTEGSDTTRGRRLTCMSQTQRILSPWG